jgi:hypothetical protein
MCSTSKTVLDFVSILSGKQRRFRTIFDYIRKIILYIEIKMQPPWNEQNSIQIKHAYYFYLFFAKEIMMPTEESHIQIKTNIKLLQWGEDFCPLAAE